MSMSNASVLLVDDEIAFVETMAKRLSRRELAVAMAFSGKEALKKLNESGAGQTDVVILDVKMPGMDGLKTLEAIKESHPQVEVIMLTGHATVENAIKGMKAGAFDFFMKPCEIDLLLSKVDEAVSKKRAREAKILEAKLRLYELKRWS